MRSIVKRSCFAASRAARPVIASIRRTPEPIPASEVKRKEPMNAVFPTWDPPHNSTENPGTSTTRTTSPYLSPKSAIAPFAFASSMDISAMARSVALSISSFTSASI